MATSFLTSISLPPRVDGPTTGNFVLQFHYVKWKSQTMQKVIPFVEIQIQWWGQQKPDQIQNIPLLSKQTEIKSKFSKISIQYPLATEVMQIFNYFSDQKALRLVFYIVNNNFRDMLGETLLNLSTLQPNKVLEEITLPIHAAKKENLIIAELCLTVTWEMKSTSQTVSLPATTINAPPQFENFEDFSKFHKKKSTITEEKSEESNLDALMKIAQNLKLEMQKFSSNVSNLKLDSDTPEKIDKRKNMTTKDKSKAKTLASPKKPTTATTQPSKSKQEEIDDFEDYSSSTDSTYSSSDEEDETVQTGKTEDSVKNYLDEEEIVSEEEEEEQADEEEIHSEDEAQSALLVQAPPQQIHHLTSSIFHNLFIHKIEEYTIFFDIKTAIPNEKITTPCFFKCKAPFLNVEVPTEKFVLTESVQQINIKKLFSMVFSQSEMYSILEKGIAFELYNLNTNCEELFLGVFTIPLHPITKCFRLNKNAHKLALQYEYCDQELPFHAYDKNQFTCKNPLFGSKFVDFIVSVYFGTEKQVIQLLSHLAKQDIQIKEVETIIPSTTIATVEEVPAVTIVEPSNQRQLKEDDLFASLPTLSVPPIIEEVKQETEEKPLESPFDDIKELLHPQVLRKKVNVRIEEDEFDNNIPSASMEDVPFTKELFKERDVDITSHFHDTDLVNFGDVLDDENEHFEEQFHKPSSKITQHYSASSSAGTITVKVKSAAGLQDALPFISKHYSNLSSAVTGGLNPFVECKILPQDFESEEDLSMYQTRVEARTFCPKFHYEKAIPLQSTSEIIQHFKKNEALFSVYHRIPGTSLKSNHIKLGTAIVSLASLATKTKNNTVSGWFNIYSFEGKVIGTLDISIQLDSKLANLIFAEERSDLAMVTEKPEQILEEEIHKPFYDICRFTVVIDEILVPFHICKAFAPNYIIKNDRVFPIYFYFQIVDIENQEFESRVYRSASNIDKLNISFAHEFKKSLTNKFLEQARHKKLQIKVYICCEDVSMDEESAIKKQSKKLGTCFVDLGALISKRSSSKTKSAWISGLYSIINEENPQTIGNCKIKCMCETVRNDPSSILHLEEDETGSEITTTTSATPSSSEATSVSSSDTASDSDLEHLDASNEAKQFIRDELRNIKTKKQDKSSSVLYTTIPSHTSPPHSMLASPSLPTFSNYLTITIEEALNLPFITDTFSFTPNLPSCYVTIVPPEFQVGKFSTHIVREKVNPNWNSHFKLGITEETTKEIVFQVWHCFSSLDKSSDKLIGECVVPLDGLFYFDKLDGWYTIQKSQAQLKVTIQPEKQFKIKRGTSLFLDESPSPLPSNMYGMSAVSVIDHLPRIVSPPSPLIQEETIITEESYEDDVEFLKLKLQEQLRELDPLLSREDL